MGELKMLDILIVSLWTGLAIALFGMLTALLMAIVYLIVRLIFEVIP